MAAPITSAEIGGAALLKPGERDYERAVATENLLYRFSRPLCVVQPRNVEQVQAIINEARVKKLRVTIKNGGHSYAGSSTADGGILLDLFRMNKVKLDMAPGSRTPEFVTLEGGAKWGHAYKELVNGRHDGYVINGGRCPTVGVSGFILGGGLSPFTRSFGMGCDTLVEATIVTANGKVITVKESDKNNSKYARGWLEHANLKMDFVKSGDADIRVSFVKGGGSWSVIGTSCRNVPKDQATMNFGWFTDTTPEMEFSRTVLHEFGHALGCIHEHQSPAGNIPWDKEAVYKYYKQTLGWDRPKVRRNIFKAYSTDITQFSSFDKKSIMLYSFPPSLTKGEFSTKPNSTLSNADKRFIAEAYPGRQTRPKVQPEPEGWLTRIKKALDGPWRGYYYFSNGTTDGLSMFSLTTRRARDDGESVAISGSGSDSVGYFTITGNVHASGRASFVKAYVGKHSWEYSGQLDESWRMTAGSWGFGSGTFQFSCG